MVVVHYRLQNFCSNDCITSGELEIKDEEKKEASQHEYRFETYCGVGVHFQLVICDNIRFGKFRCTRTNPSVT